MDFRSRIPPTTVAQILVVAALILWRIWDAPIASLWHDWVVLLSVYWIFLLCAGEHRIRGPVTLALMSGLMILYQWGQFPHLMKMLGMSS